MRHTVIAALFTFAALLAAPALAELHPLGFVSEDLAKVAPEKEVKQVLPAPGRPDCHAVLRVDLSGEMPPVGNQGGQGSCATWSTVYYHRTHLEFVERRWDLTDPHHQMSPAFVYNQINGGGDHGSGFSNNFGIMVDQGCANLVDAPYNDRDPLSWPSESAYVHAIEFRGRDWAWSRTRDTSAITLIKQRLANGVTSCQAINVYGNFDNIANYNYTYCASERTGSNRGGHLITFVGYDDTLTTADGPGAFRCVNSWGPGWGQSGYFWFSYVGVMDPFISQQAVGWFEDTLGYVPTMVGRIRINHPARDRVGISFAVGPRNVPLWVHDYRTWRWPIVDQPFPQTSVVFDMTGGAEYVANGTTDSAWAIVYDDMPDGKEGTLTYYGCQYFPWANIVKSRDVPLAIPDTWAMMYARAPMKQYNPDVGIVEGPGPIGTIDSSQTAVPQAKFRNFGQAPASFPVIMRIGSTYCDTQQVTNLVPFDTVRVQFRTWTAPSRGTFYTRCTTAFSGDNYEDNNWNSDSVMVRVHDVTLVAINAPCDTLDTACTVSPQVRVRNSGTVTETMQATFRIPDENYMRGGTRTLEAGAEDVITFPPWKSHVIGTHIACCTLKLTGDVNPADNALQKFVTVLPGAGVKEGTRPGGSRPALEAETNPFHGSVVLRVGPSVGPGALLSIYDAAGCLVRSLPAYSKGASSVVWNGRTEKGAAAPAGAYFCRLDSGSRPTTISLLKLD